MCDIPISCHATEAIPSDNETIRDCCPCRLLWSRQVVFCDTLKGLLTQLLEYVQAYHKTGLAWNPNGCDVAQYTSEGDGGPQGTPGSVPAIPAPSGEHLDYCSLGGPFFPA